MNRALPACLALALWPLAARAERVGDVPSPRPRGAWVSDAANVISDFNELTINRVIDELARTNGAEIAVVTVESTSPKAPKDFATELFNLWGVGKAGADNGVLVLLAVRDRRVEVETGYGAEGVLPDGKVGDILDRHAVPSFKAGEWGAGLASTVSALAVELKKGEPAFTKATRRVARSMGVRPGALYAGAGGVALFGLVGFGVWLSRRPPRCRRCGKRMALIPEAAEDRFLKDDQKLEESLGSMDYRVWRCAEDNELTVSDHVKWFSGYSRCSRCQRRTARSTSRTLSVATYHSTGLEEVTSSCRLPRCRHVSVHTRVIPRRTPPSSSSSSGGSSFGGGGGFGGGGSFGGGSSGGGGSGRSF